MRSVEVWARDGSKNWSFARVSGFIKVDPGVLFTLLVGAGCFDGCMQSFG